MYSGVQEFNDEEIRGKLQAFPGGSIDLIKQDSGIAVMTVNNPTRMNAFSGRPRLCEHTCCVNSASLHLALLSSEWITAL